MVLNRAEKDEIQSLAQTMMHVEGRLKDAETYLATVTTAGGFNPGDTDADSNKQNPLKAAFALAQAVTALEGLHMVAGQVRYALNEITKNPSRGAPKSGNWGANYAALENARTRP